jgi:glycosyltransferase involved in cell wall biosynthesis
MLYKVSEVDFDIVHIQHKPVTERILQLYPSLPKIATIHSEVIDLEDPIDDETILKYITIRPEIKEKITTIDGISEDKVEVVYNPIDTTKFNTTNTKDEGYILFVGTIDYLRENTIKDISNYAKENKRDLWLVGENKSNYLSDLLKEPHVKHFEPTTDVQKYVKNCHETAGILLGRTTIESWLCGKNSWIYDVDSSGIILNKELTTPPDDVSKFSSIEVAKKIKENYIEIIKQW